MNQPAVTRPKVSLAQSSPTVGTFRERDGVLEWRGRQETVRIEPWGADAVRVRARLGGPVLEGLPGARVEGGTAHVSCTVTNTGDRSADEVVQLYGRAADPSVPRPRRELLAHRRLALAPGEPARVAFDIPLTALEFWDVARGGRQLEEGPYDLLVGASSEDIRLRTIVHLDGTAPAPRPVTRRGLEGADFDERSGVAIVDRTRTAGDAVTPAHDGTAELVHRSCDFGTGVREVTAQVAGAGVLELSLDGGPVLATLTPAAPTADVYACTTLAAGFAAAGVHDVRLRLRGPLRLAHVGLPG
ncbi:fibronectin type III-like domain-contianing protein [Streptomyces sp. NPDC052101]|uniref:fibronectin type III-like domain-contianing protein n=1 Tax=Streptomyces sp. NPDC052101 TaxID=3155763 RepID=UPI00342F546F